MAPSAFLRITADVAGSATFCVVPSSAGYKLVRLANGVRSVHSLAHDETFHPVVGPAAEAEALYVRQLGLRDRARQHEGEFVVWDVGLGAAANALAVLRATQELACQMRLLSFDHTAEPLQFALRHAEQLGYLAGYESALTVLAQTGQVDLIRGKQTVRWEFRLDDFPALLSSPAAGAWTKPHAILFDAYSPAANPAMWTQPLFTRLFELLHPARPCALATYSRSTMLRVTLLLAGFFVGRGHATGEKEETTIAANARHLIADPLDARWLWRARQSTSAEPLRDAVYRQAPLSEESWEQLRRHPQFRGQVG
jgi:tRNA U34 5-methylaminomethyl-2-thiouridine-forming methyltransferase MnmC